MTQGWIPNQLVRHPKVDSRLGQLFACGRQLLLRMENPDCAIHERQHGRVADCRQNSAPGQLWDGGSIKEDSHGKPLIFCNTNYSWSDFIKENALLFLTGHFCLKFKLQNQHV
jgi:hypothetical protein